MRKFLLLAAVLFVPLCASAQTADEIIDKYIEARGGFAKLKSIQSERVSGTIVFAPGVEGPFVVERARPLKMHMEITVGGLTMIRTYDGKSGWIYNPMSNNPGVEPMTAEDLKNILEEADFEGPFVDYKAKGNKLEYAGKTAVEGKPAYKIKLTNKNGEVSYFSFDASTYLILRFQGTRKNADKESPTESFFRDFRDVDDMKYPFLVESVSPDTGDTQRIFADKVELNITIKQVRFEKPALPAAADPPPTSPAAVTPAPATPPADAPKPNE
jgi:outer membrane lipoprotein-sorting protein